MKAESMYTKNLLSMYSKTILLVDDTPLFIRMAKDLFRRHQVNLLVAKNGHEAVDLVRDHKPNLVLMDLHMPGCDGDEACLQIKSSPLSRSTPVVMVTSSDSPKDIERCRLAECDEVLQKPITREHVLELSKKYLALPGWSGKRVATEAPARFGPVAEKMLTGTLLDISVGGVFLATDELSAMETLLHLEFRLSPEKAPIVCKGRVSWVNRRGRFKEYQTPGMGVEFVDIKKLDILSIQAFVRNNPSVE